MSTKSAQLSRVLKRDRGICGVHTGGCGRKLPTRKSATKDHIIPASFISFMPPKRKIEFNKDWNIQPMCPKCNNELRGGQIHAWPLFKCRCHYLQIGGDGGMYIHDRTRAREKKHLLVEKAVNEDGTTMLLYSSRLPGDGNRVGWSRPEGGHILVPVPKKSAAAFNWFELARIGEAKGGVVKKGKNGERCVYLPNGRIAPRSEHWCARWFPIDIGHINLSEHNPFKQADQKSDEYLQKLRTTGQ